MKEPRFNLADMLADVSKLDTQEQIEYLSIDDILPDPNNFYTLSGIEELAGNIETIGLQQPIRVRPDPKRSGKYIIISGHRRHAACAKLNEDGNERFASLPCIVERQEESDSLRQLRLIYANSNTRTMTSAEVSQQVEQVEKLLYKLQEEGFSFPGRMRDHVAEACKVSTGKIARLKVIRSGLTPRFLRLWESDKLRESVAYTLAGLPPVRQNAIWSAQTNDGTKEFICTDGWVQNIANEMTKMETVCNETQCFVNYISHCDHVHVRVNHAARLSQYSGMSCKGCCCGCSWLASCRFSCEYAAQEKRNILNDQRAKKAAEKDEQKAKDAPKRAMLEDVYRRVGELRNAKGITSEEFTKVSQGYAYAQMVEKLPMLESGDKIQLTDRLPGGIWPDDAKRLIDVADLLNCSIDYLLGRTEKRCENAAETDSTLHWRTDLPTKNGRYIVVVHDRFSDFVDDCRFENGTWKYWNKDGAQVVKWFPMPEDDA